MILKNNGQNHKFKFPSTSIVFGLCSKVNIITMFQIQKIKILTGNVKRIVNICRIKESNKCYSTDKEVNLRGTFIFR